MVCLALLLEVVEQVVGTKGVKVRKEKMRGAQIKPEKQ